VIDTATDEVGWFYTQAGQRRGPVPADTLQKLLISQTIDGDTPVWRKGQADWQPLRATEFSAQLTDLPPPVAATQLNNSVVWMLAFAPLAYLALDIAILGYQNEHPNQDHSFTTALTWLIPVAVNCGLCLLDDRQLREAGYNSARLTFFAVVLAPVYLFMRAKILRLTPTYGFVWIASFIASILFRMALQSPQ
jgi:hypothetical protein